MSVLHVASAAPLKREAPAAAAEAEHFVHARPSDIWGAPVPFARLCQQARVLLYGQGAMLLRVDLDDCDSGGRDVPEGDDDDNVTFGSAIAVPPLLRALRRRRRQDQLRLWPGASEKVHGVALHDHQSLVVAWGGRNIAIVQHVFQFDHAMKVVMVNEREWMPLSDWIWDVQCCPPVASHDTVILHVALAHNEVQCWRLQRQRATTNFGGALSQWKAQCTRIWQGSIRGITYSACFARSSAVPGGDGFVAFGTVGHDILIWSRADHDNSDEPAPLRIIDGNVRRAHTLVVHGYARLVAHAGVVHSVCFDDSGRRLVSTADDRSVRLWQACKPSHTGTVSTKHDVAPWSCVWTAWGHAARTWSAAFTASSHVVSTGEDGTVRLWRDDDGAAVGVWRNHASRSLWCVSVACDQDGNIMAAVGANNGTVAIHNLSRHLGNRGVEKVPHEQLYQIPADCNVAGASLSDSGPVTASESSHFNKEQEQVIAGMEWEEQCTSGGTRFLIVATRAGSLWRLDTKTGFFTSLVSWRSSDCCYDKSWNGCCLRLHPTKFEAAIGTSSGNIVLLANYEDDVKSYRRILEGTSLRTVQKLAWLNHETLLSFQGAGIHLWSLPESSVVDTSSRCSAETKVALVTNTKGIASCHGYDAASQRVVIGDTRGNLSLFNLASCYGEEVAVPAAAHVVRAHGKEHVNGIVWIRRTRILSIGNDSCVLECVVAEDGTLHPTLSIPHGSLTGLMHVWPNDICGICLLAGYAGNTLAVIDYDSGFELISVDTGGRQRLCRTSLDNQGVTVAIGFDNGTGTLCVKTFSASSTEHQPRHEIVVGLPLHDESIFGIDSFPIRASRDVVAVVTASEDCTSRLSLVVDGAVLATKILTRNKSGVRVVAWSRPPEAIADKALLVIGGAQLTLEILLVRVDSAQCRMDSVLKVEHKSTVRLSAENFIVDNRVNTISAVNCDEYRHMIVTGDSNGACCLLLATTTGILHSTKQIAALECPILSSSLLAITSEVCLVLLGTKRGRIEGVRVTNPSGADGPEAQRLCCWQPHKIGTNAINAHLLPHDESKKACRLCVWSAADDQSVARTIWEIDFSRQRSKALMVTSEVQPADCSAIRGLSVDRKGANTISYDSCALQWSVENLSRGDWAIASTRMAITSIGDINSCCQCGRVYCVAGDGVDAHQVPP